VSDFGSSGGSGSCVEPRGINGILAAVEALGAPESFGSDVDDVRAALAAEISCS
jgi:hypothetical protein